MTSSTVMTQAKQGNPAAIATLLNRSLQPRGITATAQLEGTCLTIELTSAHPIPQATAIAFLQQGMERLQPRRMQSVFVCAQLHQADEFAWMETFTLGDSTLPPAAPIPPDEDVTLMLSSREPESPPIQEQPKLEQRPVASAIARQRPPASSSKGIEALIIGFVAAIVLFRIGFLKMLFYGAVVMVHEVGHAITHWLFGRPAIPAVNILYGGGITLNLGQVWWLNVLIYLGIGYGIYRLRVAPKLQGLAVLLTLIYTVCLLTPINQMLSVAMGHGLELIAIAVCLYLAASGRWCRIPGDRAIYAMLGWFLLFTRVEFYWQLLHDADFRASYEGGIGDGLIDNDLVILATQYFQVDLSRIATVLLFACFLAPAIGLAAGLMRSPSRS